MKDFKIGLAVILLSLTIMIGAMIFAPVNSHHVFLDSTHMTCDGSCSCDGMDCNY